MNTGTPISSKRLLLERIQLLRLDAQLRRELLHGEILSEPRGAQQLSQGRRRRRSRSGLDCSLSAIAPLLLFELGELGRARKPLRSCVAQRSAPRLLSSSRSTLKHVQSTAAVAGRTGEIPLHERAGLQVILGLVRELDHVQQRVGVSRVAGERRAETLFGAASSPALRAQTPAFVIATSGVA